MKLVNQSFRLPFAAILLCLFVSMPCAPGTANAADLIIETSMKNSWQGLTPLRSSTTDVARMMGLEADSPEGTLVGPFKVEDGEVTFTYLTPSLAKIYRAPSSMTTWSAPMSLSAAALPGFRVVASTVI